MKMINRDLSYFSRFMKALGISVIFILFWLNNTPYGRNALHNQEFYLILFIFIIIIAVIFAMLDCALVLYQERRLIKDLPTCKTIGVFSGMVELKGKARSLPGHELKSRFTGTPCAYCQWTIEEERSSKQSDALKWQIVEMGCSQESFLLQDDYGEIEIIPKGAMITCQPFSNTESHLMDLALPHGPQSPVNRRFSESIIKIDQPIYVMGPVTFNDEKCAPQIAKDELSTPYWISYESEDLLVKTHTWKMKTFLIGCGLILVIVAGYFESILYTMNQMRSHHSESPQGLAIWALLGYLTFLCVYFTYQCYASLVSLRNRVRQGLSNLDVQFKRRYELIPNLVAVVRQVLSHEQDLTLLLSRIHGTKDLKAIREAYPQLNSSVNMAHFMRELEITETKIALAREFYNDIATSFNTRLQLFPDAIFAALAGMSPFDLITKDSENTKKSGRSRNSM